MIQFLTDLIRDPVTYLSLPNHRTKQLFLSRGNWSDTVMEHAHIQPEIFDPSSESFQKLQNLTKLLPCSYVFIYLHT